MICNIHVFVPLLNFKFFLEGLAEQNRQMIIFLCCTFHVLQSSINPTVLLDVQFATLLQIFSQDTAEHSMNLYVASTQGQVVLSVLTRAEQTEIRQPIPEIFFDQGRLW